LVREAADFKHKDSPITNGAFMTPDWSLVTVEHVRQACELYNSGKATAKRPAKSTFLLLDGKTYPAKFIRGLAYRIATGIELDPNRDYAGGPETVRFFESLGLTTRHEPLVAPVESARPKAQPSPTEQQTPTLSAAVRIHREPQKQALAELLRRRFGTAEMEARFPWLTVPHPQQMDDTVRAIYDALRAMRGYSTFATFGKALCCDFFIPSEQLLIEYDERQHFTVQRATALELYPPDIRLGFDRQEWIDTCQNIRATDPLPPHRDEQRAFYDSLRDILAARNGFTLIRFRYGAFDWTAPNSPAKLPLILTGNRTCTFSDQATASPDSENIRKVALISHDYYIPDKNGYFDYSGDFARINRICDEQGCDTILYALYTWRKDSELARNHDAIFAGLTRVQRIILEVYDPPESYDHVEVWQRGKQEPTLAYQRFATSSDNASRKEAFVDELDRRRIGDALLMICGETNIASLVRGSDEFYDSYRFNEYLGRTGVRLILNPIHDYMRRYEMKEKRRYYSRDGRTVISVWNRGRGQEAHLPWTVFHDGIERKEAVQEIPTPFSDRPDIRIGIVDLSVIQCYDDPAGNH
jgi:hypothetical protein